MQIDDELSYLPEAERDAIIKLRKQYLASLTIDPFTGYASTLAPENRDERKMFAMHYSAV